MPRKTKIGTEAAHVTRDSDTTFKVKRSTQRSTCSGRGLIAAASRAACLIQDRCDELVSIRQVALLLLQRVDYFIRTTTTFHSISVDSTLQQARVTLTFELSVRQ